MTCLRKKSPTALPTLSHERSYLVTSLSREQAGVDQLAPYSRVACDRSVACNGGGTLGAD